MAAGLWWLPWGLSPLCQHRGAKHAVLSWKARGIPTPRPKATSPRSNAAQQLHVAAQGCRATMCVRVCGAEPWSRGFCVVSNLAGLACPSHWVWSKWGQTSHAQTSGSTELLDTGRKKPDEGSALPKPCTSHNPTAGSRQKGQRKKKPGCAAIRVRKLCLPPCVPALGCGDVIAQVLCC